MVVHRKDTAKYYFKVKKLCIPYEKPFLHKKILKIVSMGSNKKDIKNLKLRK